MTVNDSALLKTGFAAACAAVRSDVRQPMILADPFKLFQVHLCAVTRLPYMHASAW